MTLGSVNATWNAGLQNLSFQYWKHSPSCTPHEGAATAEPSPSRGQKALAARLPLQPQGEASTESCLEAPWKEQSGLHRKDLVAHGWAHGNSFCEKLPGVSPSCCCPRKPASWVLRKRKENWGPTRQTRRKSPKVVLMAGKQTSSLQHPLSSRLISSASVNWSWSTRLRSYWREYQQFAHQQLYKTWDHLNSETLVVSKSISVTETIKHNELHHIKVSSSIVHLCFVHLGQTSSPHSTASLSLSRGRMWMQTKSKRKEIFTINTC